MNNNVDDCRFETKNIIWNNQLDQKVHTSDILAFDSQPLCRETWKKVDRKTDQNSESLPSYQSRYYFKKQQFWNLKLLKFNVTKRHNILGVMFKISKPSSGITRVWL